MGSSWSLESVLKVPEKQQVLRAEHTNSPPLSLESLLERLEVSEKQPVNPCAKQLTSPFLRLPTELRIKIYQYIFFGNSVQVWRYWREPLSKLRVGHHRPTIAILQTCRLIQSEANDIYIAATTYSVLHVGIRAFMEDFDPSKLRLITSLECGSDEQSVWDAERVVWDDDRGFWGKGGAAKIGHMVALRRVHIVMVEFYWRVEGEKVRDMLEEVMGRRVGLDEMDVTIGEKSVIVSWVGNPRGERKRVRR